MRCADMIIPSYRLDDAAFWQGMARGWHLDYVDHRDNDPPGGDMADYCAYAARKCADFARRDLGLVDSDYYWESAT
jgi:hypothetical protein